MHLSRLVLACALSLLATLGQVSSADQWPRFRGPNGVGVSDLKGVPTIWSEEDYEWVVPLEGKGHSSPVIWDDRLFVTTSKDDGTRSIHCYDAVTGALRWTRKVSLQPDHLHQKNSYASSTPATDGERVYVTFGDVGHYLIGAWSMEGEPLWTRDLGMFSSEHGFGLSPIVYQDLVIAPYDQKGPSRVEALDVRTGKTRWTSERKFIKTSYATPMILPVGSQEQLIMLSGAVGLSGLDPLTGQELWASGELPERTVGSPVIANGKLIASCGSGGRGKLMIAVDPAQATSAAPVEIVQERTQNLPYVPTPVVQGQYLFLWNDDGVVCCVDAQGDLTKNLWRERVGGNYSGSPVIIDGRIYCISEEGEVAVLDASPVYHLYGKSPLGDPSYATPAVANGRVYLRSFHRLSCLKARAEPVAVSD